LLYKKQKRSKRSLLKRSHPKRRHPLKKSPHSNKKQSLRHWLSKKRKQMSKLRSLINKNEIPNKYNL